MLHLEKEVKAIFTTEQMLPAIGQGVIALQCKKDDLKTMQNYPSANEILLDTPAMGQSGEAFNFDLLKDIEHKKFFLAGKIDIVD